MDHRTDLKLAFVRRRQAELGRAATPTDAAHLIRGIARDMAAEGLYSPKTALIDRCYTVYRITAFLDLWPVPFLEAIYSCLFPSKNR